MSAAELIRKVYRPSMTVGQVYARPYGSTMGYKPVGNVLELTIEHKETVIKQPDMTQLGGGTYAEVRRVDDVSVSMKMADLNVINLARATLATIEGIDSGVVSDQPYTASLGGLLATPHIGITSVVLKKGPDATSAQEVDMAGNYEVRPSGIFLPDDAVGIQEADKLWLSYSHGAQAVIEALTTKAVELDLMFEGLNEADGGKPCAVNIWRASQSVTKQLALINDKFGELPVEGSVLQDPTKTGVGISKYYRQRLLA